MTCCLIVCLILECMYAAGVMAVGVALIAAAARQEDAVQIVSQNVGIIAIIFRAMSNLTPHNYPADQCPIPATNNLTPHLADHHPLCLMWHPSQS